MLDEVHITDPQRLKFKVLDTVMSLRLPLVQV